MGKENRYNMLIIIGLMLLLVFVYISTLQEKDSIDNGDIVKGTIEEISDEYIVVEIIDTDEDICFVINEDSILYIYNGSDTKHFIDDWEVVRTGQKVEIRVGKCIEIQGNDAYSIDSIGILHTWFY